MLLYMVAVHSAKHSSMPISTAALPRSFALLESSCSSEPTLSIADSIAELRTSISIWVLMLIEVLNSAIESAIDRVGSEEHELSRRAKDLGSAAVLMGILRSEERRVGKECR